MKRKNMYRYVITGQANPAPTACGNTVGAGSARPMLHWVMAMLVLLLASCSNELDEMVQPTGNGTLQFVVSDFPAFENCPSSRGTSEAEGGLTRAIGTPDAGKTAWEKDDQIIVTLASKKFGAQSAALTYDGTDWSTAVSFSYLDNETPTVSAIYAPCYEVTTDGKLQLKEGMQPGMTEYIPADCSFANAAISINFSDVTRTYSRLRIASEDGKKLTVTTTGFTPAGATEAATEPYTLPTDDNGNAFLYGTFAANATVSVGNGNAEIESHTFASATENCVSYALDAPWPYLTFTASAKQTMTISTQGYTLHESMQYSVNEGEWAQLTAGTAITFGGDDGALRIRGKSDNGTATGYQKWAKISFSNSNVQVACSGDIRTLVDYENYASASTANARFCSLFSDCEKLTTAPELPATELADNCYRNMFNCCTSLTTAPELPATELAQSCYEDMFGGCTSLTTAPKLPATTLATLCYKYMFYYCKSLTTVPDLPATTLAPSCYYKMFCNCEKLITAPELPAPTLTPSCYYYMFGGCTKLNNITMLATDISASDCLTEWVNGVAATGTFTKAAGLAQGSEAGQIPTGISGIPAGWTVVDKQ